MAGAPRMRLELDLLPIETGYADQERARLDSEWEAVAPKPEPTQAGEAAAPKPSAVEAGAAAGIEATGEAAVRFTKGLKQFLQPVQAPGEPVLGGPAEPAGVGKTAVFGVLEKAEAVKEMAMGLMGILGAPGAAVGAGLEQAVKNISPEQGQTVVFPGGPGGLAPLVRAMVTGDSRPFGKDEQARQAGEAPMTLAEVVKIVGQVGTTAALPGAVKAGRKMDWGSERGSITFPPGQARGAGPQGSGATPQAGGAAAAESRVNVARVSAPESTQQVMTIVNRLNVERLAAHRATQTHAQTIADTPSLTVEQALTVEPMALTLEQAKVTQLAVRDVYNASAQYVDDLLRAIKAGDTAAAEQLPAAWSVLGELAVIDEVLGATGARLLESRKILSEAARSAFAVADVTALVDELAVLGIDGLALAQKIEALRPAQRATFARQAVAGLKAGQNMFYEAWINALLSGPLTHAANMLSNALVAAWAPAERFLAANLDFGANRAVFRGEAAAMLRGAVAGFRDGVELMRKAWEEKAVPTRGLEKVEITPAITSQAFGLAADSTLGAAVDYLGLAIRAPGTALRLEDAFFKAVNYRMELHALAYREAAAAGLDGAAFSRFAQRIIDRPPPGVKARAEQFALVQTFNAEFSGLSGRAGSAVMSFANGFPMGRVIVPFVRTPTNILQYVGQRTPLLNALSETLRHDIAAGGVLRAQAFGKIAGGAMLAATVAEFAAAGVITGGGPKDKDLLRAKRDTGWQPYSLKVGEAYYAFNRLDPVGAMMGIVADTVEILGELPEYQAMEVGAAVVLSVMRNMTSKSYLTGLANVFELLTADKAATLNEQLTVVPKGLARSLVPTGVRQLTRVIDPHVREVNGLIDQIRAGIPGWSETLPPRRNLWAEPIVLEGGWGPDLISPIYTSSVKDDPVSAEIARLQVPISMPVKVFPASLERADLPPAVAAVLASKPLESKTSGVRLTPEEYDRLVILTGREVKDGDGNNLKQALGRMFLTEEYKRQSDGVDGGKAVAIHGVVNRFKKLALGMLRAESPALDETIRRVQAEKLIQRTPTADQPSARSTVERLIGTIGR